MGGIQVGEEEFLAGQIALISEFVINCALDIAEEMFEYFSVL